MKTTSFFLKWLVLVPLAVIGAIAIIVLLYNVFSATTGVTMSQSYGGYADEMMVFSSPSAEKSLVSFDSAEAEIELYDTAADVEQKIIKTGSLTLVVDDVAETINAISSVASDAEGFVSYSSVSELEDGTHSGNITIRVPFALFETTLGQLKAFANLVEYESVSGTDVTEEFTDLQARLGNAEAQEATYLEILDLATTVEDVLSVERVLADVREDIEVYEGRIKYLEDRTSMSTISTYLSEEASVLIPSKEFRPWTTVKEAARAFVAVVQGLVNVLIWIVIVGGGILLPLALIVWVIGKLVKCAIVKKCKAKFLKKK